MERTAWFTEARFGMFIHWGLYAIPSRGEWVRGIEKMSDAAYHAYAEEFDPVHYNPREWAALARQAGCRYAVMTAKHHDGFCLFDSALTEFKATRAPAGRDLVREYVEAFRAEGLKVGLYYSLLDWDHPDYPVDKLHPLREDAEAKARPRDFDKYLDYMHGQVRELMSNYGRIDIAWFDFSYDDMAGETWRAADLVKMVRELQPHILIDNRLTKGHEDPLRQSTGLGDFTSPEQIIPAAGVRDAEGQPVVWEACMTLNRHWGYHRDDHDFKPPRQVIHMLVETVSKGGNLLLNVGPDILGNIPETCVNYLGEVGRWMRRNSASIYGAGHTELAKPDWGRYTRKGNTLYAHILEMPAGPIILDGLGGKILRARMLADGSEVDVSKPWNAGPSEEHAFLNLPGATLPDSLDTVVALELKPDSGV